MDTVLTTDHIRIRSKAMDGQRSFEVPVLVCRIRTVVGDRGSMRKQRRGAFRSIQGYRASLLVY
jgi:hypothetical protein